MIYYTKFFGKKAGALGICYWNVATVEINGEDIINCQVEGCDVDHVHDAIKDRLYDMGYEAVSHIDYRLTAPYVLTMEERWAICDPHPSMFLYKDK